MRLYVVRHGETQANVEGRYVGSLNPALTQRGQQQARALEAQLPGHIDAIVVSPLLRARQTAVILNHSLQLPLLTMACFRERDVGVFEGLTQEQARRNYPELWAQNITRQWDIGPTGGESIHEVAERVSQGLVELMDTFAGQVVVLVAHGFVAKTIRALARHDFADFFDWQLPNGKILALENLNPSLRNYSDITVVSPHL